MNRTAGFSLVELLVVTAIVAALAGLLLPALAQPTPAFSLVEPARHLDVAHQSRLRRLAQALAREVLHPASLKEVLGIELEIDWEDNGSLRARCHESFLCV